MSFDRMHSVKGVLSFKAEDDASGNAGIYDFGGKCGFSSKGALQTAHSVESGTVATIATGGTITHSNYGVKVVDSTAGASTGVIVTAGAYPGQHLVIINNSANSVTMAVVATSNVANGTGCVIAALAAVHLIWNALDSKWYQVKQS